MRLSPRSPASRATIMAISSSVCSDPFMSAATAPSARARRGLMGGRGRRVDVLEPRGAASAARAIVSRADQHRTRDALRLDQLCRL